MSAKVATTLVTGDSAGAREDAIAALLDAAHAARDALPDSHRSSGAGRRGLESAVILEGMAASSTPLVSSPSLQVVRIAPGCLCCDGNLVLRVTLNRLLRQRPQRLYIGLARSEHLDQLRSWLQDAPYDQLLALNPVLDT
ncbi:GTPase [Massilia sp. ST3]|uniref:GTPase n=1 Tax=Massilia sp. ST3 TaxID=2824903 RepID=UPI001B80E9FC|nr:GTPase [Massilia sp. ST3]MBQ5950483.1 GTPase [Massilia sp. ST3]